MNYSEKYELLKAHAVKVQANAHAIFMVRGRIAELNTMIAENNPILAKNRLIISEKMEAMRQDQRDMLKSLNFFNSALQDLLTEKAVLWAEFKRTF